MVHRGRRPWVTARRWSWSVRGRWSRATVDDVTEVLFVHLVVQLHRSVRLERHRPGDTLASAGVRLADVRSQITEPDARKRKRVVAVD